jgi:DNA-binding MurR/RpiR family transcriptional regulator
VVRFACALGFEGYPELQKKLQEVIKTKLTNVQRMGLGSDLTEEEIVRSSLHTDITSLRHVRDVLDYKMVEKFADMILAAKRVYIMGLRSSEPLAQFFWYYLNYIIGNVTLVISGIGDVFGQIMHAGEEDVVIGISFPRYSSRTIEGAEFAKSKGAKLLAITDNAQSPLARIADDCLFVNTEMNLFVDSIVVPLSIINTIILIVGMRKKEGLKHNFEMLENLWHKHDVYMGKEEN